MKRKSPSTTRDPFAMLEKVTESLTNKKKSSDEKRQKAVEILHKFVSYKAFKKRQMPRHAYQAAQQALLDLIKTSWKPSRDSSVFDGFADLDDIITIFHNDAKLFDIQFVLELLAHLSGRWEEGEIYNMDCGEFWFPGIPMQLFAVALTLEEDISHSHMCALYDLVWGQWLTLRPDSERPGGYDYSCGGMYRYESRDMIAHGLLREMDFIEFGKRVHFQDTPRNKKTVAELTAIMKEKREAWERTHVERECPCCGSMTAKPLK